MTEETGDSKPLQLAEIEGGSTPQILSVEGREAIARDGQLKRVWKMVQLRASRNELYPAPKSGDYLIGAEGYKACNAVAGLYFAPAKEVWVSGQRHANPYVEHSANGAVVGVTVAGAMVGRSQTGNPVVTQEQMTFSPRTYLVEDLMAKLRHGTSLKGPSVHGYPINLVALRKQMEAGDTHPSQTAFVVREAGPDPMLEPGLAIVVDSLSPEIQKALMTYAQAQKFADRKANTILWRRLAAAHPGMPRQRIPKSRLLHDGADVVANVPVMAWLERADQLEELRMALQAGDASRTADLKVVESVGETDNAGAQPDAGEVIELVAETDSGPLGSLFARILATGRRGEDAIRGIRAAAGWDGPIDECDDQSQLDNMTQLAQLWLDDEAKGEK